MNNWIENWSNILFSYRDKCLDKGVNHPPMNEVGLPLNSGEKSQ